MKLNTIEIDKLNPAEYNPRHLSEASEKAIMASLSKFGFVDPVIVNMGQGREYVIVGGHQRCKVWKKMGHKEVPYVTVELSLADERELNIRLNQNTGEWDWDALKAEFEIPDLIDWGFDGETFGVFDVSGISTQPLNGGDKDPYQQFTFTVHNDQVEAVKAALSKAKHAGASKDQVNQNSNGNALAFICKAYNGKS